MTSQWEDELSLYEEEECCRVNMGYNKKNNVQFEIENKYLLHQNELLNKELMLTRYTIKALKEMVKQKDSTINQTKEDLDKSIQQIQLLTWSLKQNASFSSDDSSSSASDSDEELASSPSKFDIKSKLSIRQPH